MVIASIVLLQFKVESDDKRPDPKKLKDDEKKKAKAE
jgi:hypothetical protein